MYLMERHRKGKFAYRALESSSSNSGSILCPYDIMVVECCAPLLDRKETGTSPRVVRYPSVP